MLIAAGNWIRPVIVFTFWSHVAYSRVMYSLCIYLWKPCCLLEGIVFTLNLPLAAMFLASRFVFTLYLPFEAMLLAAGYCIHSVFFEVKHLHDRLSQQSEGNLLQGAEFYWCWRNLIWFGQQFLGINQTTKTKPSFVKGWKIFHIILEYCLYIKNTLITVCFYLFLFCFCYDGVIFFHLFYGFLVSMFYSGPCEEIWKFFQYLQPFIYTCDFIKLWN